jgi:predicted dehydrogenase
MATRLRVGLIGTGHWARAVHGPSVATHPHVELVGVWGHNQAHTTEIASKLGTSPYSTTEELFANVDALTFAVPPDVQAPIAARATEWGLHLLLEKPVALSVADALRLERAVAAARVASIVFFTRRFLPDTQAWLKQVTERDGWYSGRTESDFNLFDDANPVGTSAWRRTFGALWDLGPHALANLIPALGPVIAVTAVAGRGDQVHLIVRHTEGRSSTASFSYSSPTVSGNSLYVDGTAGRLAAPMGALSDGDSIGAHHRALDALVDQSQQAEPSHPCDVRLGARIVEVLAAARQSLITGCEVQIASLGEAQLH